MTILTAALGLADAGIIAGLGYGVVFLGLILLMIVVIIVGKLFAASSKKPAEVPATEEATEAPETPAAPGSAGQLKLHDVDPKIAAMLMAIVADKMGKPINELRFISIKEVQ